MELKVPTFFECKSCNYNTSRISQYERHLLTAKHVKTTKILQQTTIKSSKLYDCSFCGKKYKHHSSLWKHCKMCELQTCNKASEKLSLDCDSLTSFFIDSVKQNQEFQKQMVDMMKETMNTIQQQPQQLITTNNNNKIINNNQFNLNFFLNETCKDAMNIYDFMESIQIQLEDLDYTGANGYVAGVSRIFLRELKKLDVCKRPIHCTDIKREVFHVKNKDNEWHKERLLLITTIKEITRKNVVQLNEWRHANPGCMDYYHKKNDQYLKIQSEILGSADSEEDMKFYNKIISNIAKETMIDKKMKIDNE